MFSGLKVMFCGGLAAARVKIFKKLVIDSGGTVAARLVPASIFKKISKTTPLDSDLDFVIIENKRIKLADVCRQLSCDVIPDGVKIIHCSWIEQCMLTKKRIETTPFEVTLSNEEVHEDVTGGDKDSGTILTDNTARSLDVPATEVSCCEESQLKRPRLRTFESIDDIAMSFPDAEDAGDGWRVLYSLIDSRRKPVAMFKFSGLGRSNILGIIAFDMDGTLITTKSGKTFSETIDDWQLLYGDVPAKIRQKHADGYHIAIISNQNGVSKGHATLRELQTKIDLVVGRIGVPVDIICAFEKDFHRKPRPGSWNLLVSHRFPSCIADRDLNADLVGQSVYVGDAAGRPAVSGRKKDFSSTDLKFALNIGLQFQTPEQFFCGSTQPLHTNFSSVDLGFSWKRFVLQSARQPPVDPGIFSVTPGHPEIIVLMGPPACGKSTLARRMVEDSNGECVRVNQDVLKTRPACVKVAEAALRDGKSVVVDNTNTKRAQREDWLNLAANIGVPVRCIRIDLPKDVCFHLHTFRLCSPTTSDADRREVPKMVIHSFYKNSEFPTVSEGYSRVDVIPFTPRQPDDHRDVALILCYLD